MASLIENVLSLEQEADAIIAAAHAEARQIEERAEMELRARRETLEAEAAARLAAFREEAVARHREELAKAEQEAESAAASVRNLDKQALERQADKVVGRFKAQ